MLQDGETILHQKNEDPYNLLSDKLVSMNKVKGRIPLNQGQTAHDQRFNLPNSLPKINSKHKNIKAKYDWNTDKGREYPVYFNKLYNDHWNLKTDQVDRMYDFDLEKTKLM